MKSKQSRIQGAYRPAADQGISQPRHPARPDREIVHMAERPRAQRRAVPRPVVGEKLALESRHINANRAFRLTGAALETEVEHLVHALIAKSSLVEPSRHHETERVRPPSRRVRFFFRRH